MPRFIFTGTFEAVVIADTEEAAEEALSEACAWANDEENNVSFDYEIEKLNGKEYYH